MSKSKDKTAQPIINIPEIQKKIKSSHSKFIKELGLSSDKVSADHRLLSDMAMARLQCIVGCLKQEKVIDECVVDSTGPVKKCRIWKNGRDNYIEINTNGTNVFISGHAGAIDVLSSDFVLIKKRFIGISAADYDWVAFTDDLMDTIHSVIYERKEAAENRITSMFTNMGK